MIATRTPLAALPLLFVITACPTGAPFVDDDAGVSEEPSLDVCSATLTWSEGPTLPMTVDHHHTFVAETAAGPGLYVVGGFDGQRARDDVYRAAINDDGTLEAFEPAGTLPAGRTGAALLVSGSTVVLAGGGVQGAFGMSFSNTVVVGELADDGSLGDFRAGPALPGVRFHASGAVHGERLYVSGGVTGDGATQADVFLATLDDGGLSEWETVATLTPSRSHHASIVVGDRLLLVGGLTGNPFQNATTTFTDVLAADIAADGSLSDFEMEKADIGFALSTHAASVADGCFFVVGGGAGESFEANDVVYRVDADVREQATALEHKLPAAFTHRHHAPLYREAMYAVAGGLHHVPSDRVFVGLFTE